MGGGTKSLLFDRFQVVLHDDDDDDTNMTPLGRFHLQSRSALKGRKGKLVTSDKQWFVFAVQTIISQPHRFTFAERSSDGTAHCSSDGRSTAAVSETTGFPNGPGDVSAHTGRYRPTGGTRRGDA